MAKSPKETKGPIVKTGPTRGKNRSRNDNGRWRAKRSDAGKARNKSKNDNEKGCFLTTAACQYKGLPDNCYELQTMRKFRDDFLSRFSEGRELIAEYYRIAPQLTPLLKDKAIAEDTWNNILRSVTSIESGDYDEATTVYRKMVNQLQLMQSVSDKTDS
ncbi:MAG: hypothetical protein QGI08_03655 [Paracoccaceae bacterium]|nr:hypothetical protein [Paracoccaceae bacterium]MDP7184797.1 hypothetical protein [Paracoccaceae bacterium]